MKELKKNYVGLEPKSLGKQPETRKKNSRKAVLFFLKGLCDLLDRRMGSSIIYFTQFGLESISYEYDAGVYRF